LIPAPACPAARLHAAASPTGDAAVSRSGPGRDPLPHTGFSFGGFAMPTQHRTGHRSGPTLATRGTSEDNLVAAYPGTAAVLVFLAALLALLTPAVLVLAAVRHLSLLGLIGAGATLLLYHGGYLAAVWPRRALRRPLAPAR